MEAFIDVFKQKEVYEAKAGRVQAEIEGFECVVQ